MSGGRVNAACKLRLPPAVKLQLEALAAERGETISETVAALVALAWGDAPPVQADDVRASLDEARRAAKGRRRRANA